MAFKLIYIYIYIYIHNCHQIWKPYENSTSMLVFTIVFRIHFNDFIILPNWLKISRSKVFSLFHKINYARPKTKVELRDFAHLSKPDQHETRKLSRPMSIRLSVKSIIEELQELNYVIRNVCMNEFLYLFFNHRN